MSSYNGPVNPNPKDGEASIIIYGYVPSDALAIVAVVTFAIILAVNLYYLVKRRGYRSFHALLCVGSLMEVGGYAARIASHKNPFVVATFVAQYFLIVVAPVLFTAAIYLSLSLAVKGFSCGDQILILRPKLVLAFFITADVVTTIIQVVGAALIGVAESDRVSGDGDSPVTPKQANDILLSGLVVQTFSFLCFLTILCITMYRATKPELLGHLDSHQQKRLQRLLYVIMGTSDLILLRTTFRLAETAQGFFGFASTTEWLFGILEYTPVIIALILWAIFPPSHFIRSSSTNAPTTPDRAADEMTQVDSASVGGRDRYDVQLGGGLGKNDKTDPRGTGNARRIPAAGMMAA